MSALLELNDVSKRFGGLVAVNNVRIEVAPGEIVGLLGPNGSGKTTLLNLVSGALPPSEGKIIFDNHDLSGLRADQIAQYGISRTFQLVRILPSMSVLENAGINAAFGPKRLWGSDLETVAIQQLERVGLADRMNDDAASLTYIDQKRLELARALASEPQLLLLDEWLAGLNPTELHQGIDLIHSLRDTGLTIVLVEHIMEAVRSLCPDCIVMNSGSIIASGATEEVLTQPDVVAAYLGDADV